MVWEIRLEKGAEKELDRSPVQYRKKILATLPIIAEDPFVGKKLTGELAGLYSYRAWPYRIIYKVYKKVLVVIIIRIRHRQEAYK
jgi:mRNA interferase RelE/StbE